MHFHDGAIQRLQRIAQRDRGMGIGTGVDHHARRLGARLLDPLDQFAFVVRLPENDGQSMALGSLGGHLADLDQRDAAVNVRLPRP